MKIFLAQKNKSSAQKKILPFEMQYHLALHDLKDTFMGKRHLTDNQPQLREIFKVPPPPPHHPLSQGKIPKDILVKAKL